MRLMRSTLTAIVVSAAAVGACRADQEAAEPVDMSPDPRIEQAPAYPTPPGEVPTGLEPDTGPRPGVDLDTIPAAGTDPGGSAGTGALPPNDP